MDFMQAIPACMILVGIVGAGFIGPRFIRGAFVWFACCVIAGVLFGLTYLG